MCGIAGYTTLFSDKPINQDALNVMLKRIDHRGPDSIGVEISEKVALGNARLSILDLFNGDQPISNEDETITVVFNGEIYNYPELKFKLEEKGHKFKTRTDTEVLVHLYEEKGEEFISSLNGMFAFALYDKKRQLLLIARDRFGVKPLFYTNFDGELRFGSEIKTLSWFPDFDNSLSPEGMSVAIGLMFIAEPWTAYKNIRRLRQGHYLRIDQSGVEEHCFSNWSFSEKIQIDHNSAAEETADLLKKSVKRQMQSDLPVSVLLSGGLDSKTISHLASLERQDVEAFTISFDEHLFDESAEASDWSDYLNIPHHKMLFSDKDFCQNYFERQVQLDEPYTLWCNTASASMAKLIQKRGFKVVLGGDGGDELFLGYPTIRATVYSKYYKMIPQLIRERLITPLVRKMPAGKSKLPFTFMAKSFVEADNPDLFRMFFGFKEVLRYKSWPKFLTKEARDFLDNCDPFIAHYQYLKDIQDLDLIDALSYLDYKVFMSGVSLYGADNAYMSSSVELRVPFLDNDLASFAASLPTNVRFGLFAEKPVLKTALKNRILSKTELNQKSSIKSYRKAGFDVPVSAWLQKPSFRDFVQKILSKKRIDRTGFFQYPAVKEALEDQLSGKENNERLLQVFCGVVLFLE